MELTRRELALAAIAAAPRATAAPQTQTPDDELTAACARLKATSDTLAKQDVPMATEPAFQFKA